MDVDDDLPRPAWPAARIGEIAGRQHGQISRAQLIDLGVGTPMIDAAVRRGLLVVIHRGVYAVGHLALPPLAPFMAAVLAVGGAAFVSHAAAAAIWALTDQPRPDGMDIDVTIIDGDRGRRRPGIRVHRDVRLDLRDVVAHVDVPVTTPARTVLDLVPSLSSRQVERAVDALLTRRLATRQQLAATVARCPHHAGAGRLAALAEAERRIPEAAASEAEERFLALIRRAGLSMPRTNVYVEGYEVDALWPAERVIAEVDGYAFHSTRGSFEADHARDLALAAAGYVVLRFTYRQVVEHPETVVAAVVRALTARAAQLGRSSRMVS